MRLFMAVAGLCALALATTLYGLPRPVAPSATRDLGAEHVTFTQRWPTPECSFGAAQPVNWALCQTEPQPTQLTPSLTGEPHEPAKKPSGIAAVTPR
jgi:hypothetical protein